MEGSAILEDLSPGSLGDADAPARVREAGAAFEASETQSSSWWLVPGVPAAPWKPLLLAEGFTHVPRLPGMALGLAGLGRAAAEGAGDGRAEGVEIRRVETPAVRRAWAETCLTIARRSETGPRRSRTGPRSP